MSVRREVGRGTFPKFSGFLTDLKRFENSKSLPDQDKLNFYTLVGKALMYQHARFRHFSDDDVEQIFNTISPILKACVLSKTREDAQGVIEKNKSFLLSLIQKTGVTL